MDMNIWIEQKHVMFLNYVQLFLHTIPWQPTHFFFNIHAVSYIHHDRTANLDDGTTI